MSLGTASSITISGPTTGVAGTYNFDAVSPSSRVIWYVNGVRGAEQGAGAQKNVSLVMGGDKPTTIQAITYPYYQDPNASIWSNVITFTPTLPDCATGTVRNPTTQACVSTTCGTGFVWNGTTYNCDPVPVVPTCDAGYTLNTTTNKCEAVPVVCGTGFIRNATTNKCDPVPVVKPPTEVGSATYAASTTAATTAAQNTDVFHKDATPAPTASVLTVPFVASAGLLAYFLFRTM